MRARYSIPIGWLSQKHQPRNFYGGMRGIHLVPLGVIISFLGFMSTGRDADLNELVRLRESESNPETIRNIDHTINKVANESGAVRSMREALIRAHRNGDVENIKDIHDSIRNKSKYH